MSSGAMHYHRLRCSASLSLEPCFASSSIVSMPRSLSAFCRFIFSSSFCQECRSSTYHETRVVLFEELGTLIFGVAFEIFYPLVSFAFALNENPCFLTFAVPFEEACVVFSNSFVKQNRYTQLATLTHSLISLHSGARDADMMKFFLTGSSLCFPSDRLRILFTIFSQEYAVVAW